MTVSLTDLTRVFTRIGLASFGGPAAQIGLLHREVLEERRWISEEEYLRALSFCMLLPGPEAMQLATWIGWRLRGITGGLIAGGLFVLPGAMVVLALSLIYALLGNVPFVAALFVGIQAAVVAVVIEALWKLSKRALSNGQQRLIALAAFVSLFFLNLPFPLIILAAGLWGFSRAAKVPIAQGSAPKVLSHAIKTGLVWAVIWIAPLAALTALAPERFAQIGLFFAKLAAVSFGGAYALLAWMSQEVVTQNQWLTLPQMMDGLALAESTPGPLILVTEFVGFMAGFGVYGIWGGVFGALVALWATFIPSFMFIFAGAPMIERLTHMPRLSEALRAITAAVVGVIANLSLWFSLHVLFERIHHIQIGPLQAIYPQISSLKPLPSIIAILALYALMGRKWSLTPVLCLAALIAVTAPMI